jgi:N-dimethylarginine dimethylaminohydrolase
MTRSSTGPEPDSSLGGAGWIPRTASHAEEVARGVVWRECGYRSEVAQLREIMICRPPDSLAEITDSRAWLMRQQVDLARLHDQAEAVAEYFRAHQVIVQVARPPRTAPPNLIFMRDLFLMTPHGAVIARMASAQRAGEERYATAALAGLGLPILRTITGTGTFEGADALWIDQRTVLVAVGFRTNDEGARQLGQVLSEQGVTVLPVPLGPGAQHLLGAVTFLDERLAAVHQTAATDRLRRPLLDRGYQLVELPANDGLLQARGMNLVALAPGVVVMPSGAPTVRRALVAAGVDVEEMDVSEYVKADGALGCLTGILRRDQGQGNPL